MPKRRTHDSDGRFGAEDSPIGLTSAFAPVKGPQSVDYDTDDDPVGLTQAFGAIPEQDEPHAWDEAGKWRDFDWDASYDEPAGRPSSPTAPEAEAADGAETPDAPEASRAETAPAPGRDGSSAAAHGSEGDSASAPAPKRDTTAPSRSERDETPAPAASAATASAPSNSDAPSGQKGPKRGRHAAPEPELSPRMRRSQRTRRVLIVLVVLLIIVIGALGYFVYRTFSNSQQEAAQQAQQQLSTQRDDISDAPADDATESTTRLADVPDLTVLLGKTADEAIASLGRGALITSNREVNEEGNPIKTNLNVALTEEAADSKTGTPTVYLGLGEDGIIRQAGYSASASALGFGSLSFADAVNNENVIEKTLLKIGVTVPEDSAVLPANKDEYSTYGSDGTTVVRERCSFEGPIDVNGTSCNWSAVLSYDYTTQVVTGNLSDTVRIIYVYITMN